MKAGFSGFGKNEKWAADQVNVANARQGRINAEHEAKQAIDKAAELRKEKEEFINTLKLAAKVLQEGKHNKDDLDAFNKKIANLKVDNTVADDKTRPQHNHLLAQTIKSASENPTRRTTPPNQTQHPQLRRAAVPCQAH